jgi:ankyrin repeat protein
LNESCRGRTAAALSKEAKMSPIRAVILLSLVSLAPAAMSIPAPASEPNTVTQGHAALPPGTGAGVNMNQDHIKEIFFDAARQGRADLLDGLIKSGMKPDERDPNGYTALILAAYNGQAATVDFLVQHGADACAADPKGNSSLMGVAFKGETAIAQRLIADHCDVNARNNAGQTALMMAALFGQTDVVKLLLKSGAKPELQDQSGNTAAHLAQQQANPQMVELLTQASKGQ